MLPIADGCEINAERETMRVVVGLVMLFGSLTSMAQSRPSDRSKCSEVLSLVGWKNMQFHPVIGRCDVFQPHGIIQAVVEWPEGRPNPEFGLPVNRLEVFRKTGGPWQEVLKIDEQVKNPFGYIGIDYIDPHASSIYWISFSKTVTNPSDFRIYVVYSTPNGRPDAGAVPLEIGWNEALRCYEEVAANGSGFVREKSQVPIRKH
jgi:hypothetical protein